jgi:hypothetical protein
MLNCVWQHGQSYDEALATLRLTRPTAKPNVGFEQQLRAGIASLTKA